MSKFFRAASLVVLALGLTAMSAQAQQKTMGLIAGVDFSTLTGSDVNSDFGNVSSKTGFMGGLFVAVPLGNAGFAFEPELLYANKGGKYSFSTTSGTLSLNYFSIPLMFRWNQKTTGGFYLLAGPQISFNVGCHDNYTDSETSTSFSQSCSDAGVSANTVVTGTFGAGFGKGKASLEGRYNWDWGNALKIDATNTSLNVHNSVWSILLRFTK